ncbi:MAG: hypothetical protein H7A23_11715 [Leptospiraceae bacterium]|nr:hypothetical protein [Leptospiraceae bacterium]MCP5495213.1 hypothetical protein [Leptospiraceae bacterium]
MSVSQSQKDKSPIHVLKEKDAVLMGIHLNNKHQIELLKTIRNFSTLSNAAQGHLYSANEMYHSSQQLDYETIVVTLNQLVSYQLISQAFAFKYDQSKHKLSVVSFFISHPVEEKKETLEKVFEEMMFYSYCSIREWFYNSSNLQEEEIYSILLAQFSNSNQNQPDGIKNIFSPLREIELVPKEVNYKEEIISYTHDELIKLLVENKLGIEIAGYGVLLLKEPDVVTYFETTYNFISDKVIPAYKSDLSLKRQLDKIDYEENVYNITESFPIKTGRFCIQKAKAIKDYKSFEEGELIEYPGSLAIESILGIEGLVETRYKSLWREDCNKKKRDFKKKILSSTINWVNLISFITQEESMKFHPEIWSDLVRDRDLIYSKWQLPYTTIHIFVGRDFNICRLIVKGLVGVETSQLWKAQSFINLLEENKAHYRPILRDSEFSMDYMNLLKRVYIPFLPWYYRILFFFSFMTLQDTHIDRAKKKLLGLQSIYRRNNVKNLQDLLKKIEEEKVEKLSQFKSNTIEKSLMDILDKFYFDEGQIPTFKEVLEYFPDFSEREFLQAINQKHFKVVTLHLKKTKEEVKVILYPQNSQWTEKKKRLKTRLNEILEEQTKQLELVAEPEKIPIETTKKLIEYLEKSAIHAEIAPRKRSLTDPYIRLKRHISKIEPKEEGSE